MIKPLLTCLIMINLISTFCLAEGKEGAILPDVNYDGDITERSTLSGNWGGVRNDLSERGIQFDNYATHVTQNVADGGLRSGPIQSRVFPNDDDTASHLSWDNVVQFDTAKLNLWPGGVFKFRGEGRTGDGVVGRAGAISPVNSDLLFPLDNFGETSYDLTEATYTQFLSPYGGVILGVLNTLDGDKIDFAGSERTDGQFMNLAFRVNPVLTKSVPYKTNGAGIILLPTKDIQDMLVTATVMNTEDSSGTNSFTKETGNTFNLEVAKSHRIFDLPGKQNFGYVYADDESRDLEDPRLGIGGTKSTKGRTYAAYYSFHQYLDVQSDINGKTEGVGIFGRFGYSDSNPNPMAYAYVFGFGGNNPWRSQDTFGLGAYYLDLTSATFIDNLGVADEQGLELWYTTQVFPWLHLTPDFQVVDSGLSGAETAYVFGIRTHWDF